MTNLAKSEEIIKDLKNELLRLKLIVHNQERKLARNGRPPGQDLDETKRDLIADLMTNNDELRKQIEEMEEREREKELKKKPVLKDAACQTNLDRFNIDQLIEAKLTLKRQNRQQQLQQQQPQHQSPTQLLQTQPVYHSHYLQQQPPTQQHYPQPPQQQHHEQQPQPLRGDHFAVSTKHMYLDEKEVLDKLFGLDGQLTTILDRLRARV